jgi:cysteine desulfurase
MEKPVYLDYNSTTPVDQRVLETMLPYFTEKFGNASSHTHQYGWTAKEAVKIAREHVAKLINCIEQEIIFTSGATEAINLAIKGVFEAYSSKGNHIVTLKTEHKAVLDVCSSLEKKGAQITYLGVDETGNVNLQELEQSITERTILVCIMYANNETGLIHPVKEIARIVHDKNSVFMSDASQAVGKIPVDVQSAGIDILCLSAHKIYGPKGVGALYTRRKNPRVTLRPLIEGGGHEKGLRSGTLNVPGIVALGKACEIAGQEIKDDMGRIQGLRDSLQKELIKISGARVNGVGINMLPNTLNISFEDIKSERLIIKMRPLAVSTGSACTSANPEPSHVLKAMGLSDELALGSVRISLGKYSTKEEVVLASEIIKKAVEEERRLL